jgi:hypothetical protein
MVKLILHTGECRHDDDPSLPFLLELVMRPPEFMIVAFVSMHGGTEEVVARGDTAQELKDWMREHGLDTHPRLSRWRIVEGPERKLVEEYDRSKPKDAAPAAPLAG